MDMFPLLVLEKGHRFLRTSSSHIFFRDEEATPPQAVLRSVGPARCVSGTGGCRRRGAGAPPPCTKRRAAAMWRPSGGSCDSARRRGGGRSGGLGWRGGGRGRGFAAFSLFMGRNIPFTRLLPLWGFIYPEHCRFCPRYESQGSLDFLLWTCTSGTLDGLVEPTSKRVSFAILCVCVAIFLHYAQVY